MVPLMSLWMPILLSAVFVFIASSIIHMALAYHRNDFLKLPKEDDTMAALRGFNIPPGDYAVPCAGSIEGMKKPEFVEKMKAGPVIFMTVVPSGPPAIGGSLVVWFLYSILVSVFAGYIAGRALAAGANYLTVFRFAGCVAFAGYSLGILQNSIWYKRNWGTTLLYVFDGLVYGLLTAGTFGWLWPRVICVYLCIDFRFFFAYTESSRKAMQNDSTTKTRPEILTGRTIKVRSPFGTVFVTINENGDNRPFELFLNVGKCGSDVAADAEAIGRLCSLLLRIPSPVPEEKRIELIVSSLTGIGGNGDVLFGTKRIRSLPDAVACALSQYAETRAEMRNPGCANDSPSGPPRRLVNSERASLKIQGSDIDLSVGESNPAVTFVAEMKIVGVQYFGKDLE